MLIEARASKKHRIYTDNEIEQQDELQLSWSLLPTCILVEILSRLPVKFLCSLRKVCKSWYHLICSHGFAKLQHAHAIHSASPSLVVYSGRSKYRFHWLDHLVFDTYQDSASAYSLKFDELAQMDRNEYYIKLRSANGLFCLFPCITSGIFKPYCVWNPIIQEHVLLPQSPRFKTIASHGFGYDSSSESYKVVRVLQSSGGRAESDVQYGEAEAEVYTLGSGMWRSIKNVPYPHEKLAGLGIFMNGSCHWISSGSPFILVFNLTTERFHVMHLPSTMGIPNIWYRRELYVLGKWLCLSFWLLETFFEPTHEFWVMKDYEKQEWTKEYDFGATHDDQVYPVMKLRNGEVLCYKTWPSPNLSYYEPQTKIYREFMLENDRVTWFWLTEHVTGSLFSPMYIENQQKSTDSAE